MNIFSEARKARKEARAKQRLENLRTATPTPEQIQKNYAALCGEAGDKGYRIKVLETELQAIHSQMHEMNQKYSHALAVHGDPNYDESPKENKNAEKTA